MHTQGLIRRLRQHTPTLVVAVGHVTVNSNGVICYALLWLLTESAHDDRPLISTRVKYSQTTSRDQFVEGDHHPDLQVDTRVLHSSEPIDHDSELLRTLVEQFGSGLAQLAPDPPGQHLIINASDHNLVSVTHPQLLQLWTAVAALIDRPLLTRHERTLLQRLRTLIQRANELEAERHRLAAG